VPKVWLGSILNSPGELYLIISSVGVSVITQVLYIFVFCTRYTNLFWTPPLTDWHAWWNFVLKIFYILSSFYIVLMMRVYTRTREGEKAWRFGAYTFSGSAVLAPFVYLIFKKTVLYRGFWGVGT
jgi:hypothetical protein